MADFVIVGGGVYGCGVAWELAKRGAEVHLIEAEHVASGASGGLGKRGVRANGRDLRELPFMRLSYDLWPILHEQIGAPTGYERTGHLLLIERDQDYGLAAAQVWMQTRQGIPSQLVAGAALREMEPYLNEQITAAIYCPKDGVADHTATTQGLAQAARKLGVKIQEQTAIIGLERRGEQVTGVITDQEEVIPVGHTLLLLSNAHIPAFVQQHLGLTLPVWPMLPQVLLTEPVEPMPLRHLIGHAHRVLAMKHTPDGRVMISGGWRGRWNHDTDCGETIPDQVDGNWAEAVAAYPGLAGVAIAEAAADRLELISIDQIPILDYLPNAENMMIAAGWSGHGWAIAPAVSQALAEWAYTGVQPELLQPFGFGRFRLK